MTEQAFQITVYETLFLLGLIFAASLLLGKRVKLFWLISIVIIAFSGKLILFLGAGGMLGNYMSRSIIFKKYFSLYNVI